MHNVSVGDIFMDSNEVFRVIEVLENEKFPEDPLIEVEVGIKGRFDHDSWVDWSFTLEQAEKFNLQHYKAAK